MNDAEAETARNQLIIAITDAEQLLRRYSTSHWADALQRAGTLIEGRDFSGVDDLFTMFGGMGSFNDILIHPLNGDRIDDSEVDRVNERLRSLGARMHELVTALRTYWYAH